MDFKQKWHLILLNENFESSDVPSVMSAAGPRLGLALPYESQKENAGRKDNVNQQRSYNVN